VANVSKVIHAKLSLFGQPFSVTWQKNNS